MKRRFFVHNVSLFATGLLGGFASANNNNPMATLSERELVGIDRPTLYGKGFNLRKEAAQALNAMIKQAAKEGLHIYSASSYRSFERQRLIWNRKFRSMHHSNKTSEEKVREILTYSSLPGSSRHHWGTDADLIDLAKPQPEDVLLPKHFKHNGVFHDLYCWLKENAPHFDFYEAYPNDEKRTGYNYEPWHWSYAPLAVPFTEQFMKIDLRQYINVPQMEGREVFTVSFVEQFKQEWGLGINPDLIPKSYQTSKP